MFKRKKRSDLQIEQDSDSRSSEESLKNFTSNLAFYLGNHVRYNFFEREYAIQTLLAK